MCSSKDIIKSAIAGALIGTAVGISAELIISSKTKSGSKLCKGAGRIFGALEDIMKKMS